MVLGQRLRTWSLREPPFFEVVVYILHRFCTLRIQQLWIRFLASHTGGENKKIHDKLNPDNDESSKKGRIVREAGKPGDWTEKDSKRAPVSFAIEEKPHM